MGSLALIGLGSNLGDRKAVLDGALEAIRRRPGVNLRSISRYHETRPIGGPPGQGPFLNAVALLEPSLDPLELLSVLHEVEGRFGRERTVRWGERTLDLDLLLFGGEVSSTPELVLPHPRFAFRRFVLAPAVEVAAGLVDPLTQLTVADLLSNLDRRPSLLCIDHLDRDHLALEPGIVAEVHRRVVDGLGAVGLTSHEIPAGRCQPADRWKRHYRRVTELARSLSARRWNEPHPTDRWLVSDFSLTQEMLRGAISLGQSTRTGERSPGASAGLARSQGLAARAVRSALRPTLVALVSPGRDASVADRHYLHPLLFLSSVDPGEIAVEILAACAATRD